MLTLGPADTVLAVAPMYHCMGLIVVVANALAQGATVVTMMRFGFEPFLQAMQDHRVTATVIAPPIALGSRRPSRRRRLRPVRAALGRLRRGPPRRPDRGDLRAPAATACSGRATA